MDDPDYLIVNPIQIEIILKDYTTEKINNKKELTELEERFNCKMERLKNISLQNKRLKNMIQRINYRLILVDV
tara:strand:- start:527 stop:745 length:219 start_codon:yes stop_codon:yes gene_type:complete